MVWGISSWVLSGADAYLSYPSVLHTMLASSTVQLAGLSHTDPHWEPGPITSTYPSSGVGPPRMRT